MLVTVIEFFIVSDLQLQKTSSEAEMNATVASSAAGKCGRCWRYVDSVGQNGSHPDLCHRCVDALPEGFSA